MRPQHRLGYAWLYIGSFAIGLGAAAIAFAFPAPVREEVLDEKQLSGA